MTESVSRLLEQRQAIAGRKRRLALVASVGLHLLLVVAVVAAPNFFQGERQALEFVEVLTLPAARIDPGRPPTPAPPAEPPPEPEPEPAPEPEPEAPEDIPVIQPEEAPERRVEPPRPADDGAAAREDPVESAPGRSPASSSGSSDEATAIGGYEDPDFVYDYYGSRIAQLIRQRWRRPRAREGIETLVRFRIQSSGEITEIELLQSSGNSLFDRAALEAVRAASPLPPLPRSYRKPSLGVRLVVR